MNRGNDRDIPFTDSDYSLDGQHCTEINSPRRCGLDYLLADNGKYKNFNGVSGSVEVVASLSIF